MNILVVGCNGQLGSDCMSVFQPRYSVRGADFLEIDITDRISLHSRLDELEPQVIVNCAAYTAVDACETDSTCWQVNDRGPAYLAEWCAANNAFLVHISTDYVFDGDLPLFEPYDETSTPGPVSEYGRSKLAGEVAIQESGADAAILRTAWLYGANGNNFLKTMLRLALQDPERELRVVNDQFGSPTWSRTLARQIAAVIDKRVTGVFHATSQGYCSWHDLASRFLALMKAPCRVSPCTSAEYPTAATRPQNSILANAALATAGIDLFADWEQELQMFVDAHSDELHDEIGKQL